jgi:DNA end-binding protein Ku
LLRFAHEIKDVSELEAGDALDDPPEVNDKEIELAEQLVAALDEPWAPEQFRDEYRDDLLELIEQKAKTGKAPVKRGDDGRRRGAEVVDMMELLKKSVGEAKGRRGQRRRKAS